MVKSKNHEDKIHFQRDTFCKNPRTLFGTIFRVVRAIGEDMADARARARVAPRIAYMPQGLGRNLSPTLSVRENLDFFGRLFGQPAAERDARIAMLLEATMDGRMYTSGVRSPCSTSAGWNRKNSGTK